MRVFSLFFRTLHKGFTNITLYTFGKTNMLLILSFSTGQINDFDCFPSGLLLLRISTKFLIRSWLSGGFINRLINSEQNK